MQSLTPKAHPLYPAPRLGAIYEWPVVNHVVHQTYTLWILVGSCGSGTRSLLASPPLAIGATLAVLPSSQGPFLPGC